METENPYPHRSHFVIRPTVIKTCFAQSIERRHRAREMAANEIQASS